MQVLICDALSFMRPYLQKVELTDSIRTLYKGLLCILLVLLHDFPSFLCQYHFAFCDLIPTTCVQMRNLVLSAFPRTMRLPDPFTPNLKVSELPEISIAPRILSDYVTILDRHELRQKVEKYLKTGKPTNFVHVLLDKCRTKLNDEEKLVLQKSIELNIEIAQQNGQDVPVGDPRYVYRHRIKNVVYKQLNTTDKLTTFFLLSFFCCILFLLIIFYYYLFQI